MDTKIHDATPSTWVDLPKMTIETVNRDNDNNTEIPTTVINIDKATITYSLGLMDWLKYKLFMLKNWLLIKRG